MKPPWFVTCGYLALCAASLVLFCGGMFGWLGNTNDPHLSSYAIILGLPWSLAAGLLLHPDAKAGLVILLLSHGLNAWLIFVILQCVSRQSARIRAQQEDRMKPIDPNSAPTHYLEWSQLGASAIWRYIATIVLGFTIWIFGSVPFAVLFPSVFTNPSTKGLTLEWGFLPGLLGILLLTRFLLGRPAYSLLSPSWPLRGMNYLTGIFIGYGVATLLVLLDLPFSKTSYGGFHAEAGLGIGLLFALLVGFAIQTAFEELFFRGLIMQLIWRIKAWLPGALVLQAVLFALPHFGNVSSWDGLGLVTILPYVFIASAWGWVGWRTGSLLVPMGLHFANNTYSVLFVGTMGDIIVSYAPFQQATPSLVHGIIGVIAQGVLTIIAVELWLRRRARRGSQG